MTLKLIESDVDSAYCRFPARTVFLKHVLQLDIPKLDASLPACPELEKYIQHVPFEQLELVFASEIFSSATSMMGHIFLKADGKNFRNTKVSHSLAYFTEITTLNPAKLISESLITGMSGFFTVRPFSKDIEQYLEKEKRNLWQFRLRGSDFHKRLLQLHLWELKGAKLTYYFQSYNCATLTLELISILEPKVMEEQKLFVSPVDVVKAVIKHDLVEQTEVMASPKWLLNSIEGALSKDELDSIKPWLNDQETSDLNSLTSLSQQYLSLAIPDSYTENGGMRNFNIDLSDYKHPANTPQDSAIGFSVFKSKSDRVLGFNFLSSGHYLYGDNRQYLYESELVLGKVSGSLSIDSNDIDIQEATIYSVKNLTPTSQFNPSWSSEFYFGLRPSYTDELKFKSLAELSFGLGKSKKLHRDILGYLHVVGGLTSNIKNQEWFTQIKSGVVLNLINDSKLTSELRWGTGKWSKSRSMFEIETILSWFPSTDKSVSAISRFSKNSEKRYHSLGIEYNHYF
nr:DUF4105 domain-containing protein [Pseudoalteromonas sp. Of7M-16]